MRASIAMIALLALGGCGGGSKDDPTTGLPLPGTGPTDSACDSATTDCNPIPIFNPVAVGVEIDGVLYEDGTFHDVRFSDGSAQPPFIRLIFADIEFFSLASDQQDGHFCEIGGVLTYAVPQDSSDPAFNTQTGAPLNWSYEFNFEENITGLVDCSTMNYDEAVWGPNMINLTGPFQGAHLGIGFGAMTDYLWDAYGGVDDPANADYLDKFFTMYVAMNDRDGHWGGCDWTSALLFNVDDQDIPTEDPGNPGYLEMLAVDAVGTGPMPKGYIRTFAYWYQDFPLMDFANLSQAPTGQSSWLCE